MPQNCYEPKLNLISIKFRFTELKHLRDYIRFLHHNAQLDYSSYFQDNRSLGYLFPHPKYAEVYP